jgi:hypothetical protein
MLSINLADFFKVLEGENYCIIKRGDIEKYKTGSDFDIFCFDLHSFSKKIMIASQKYVKDGYKLKINDSRKCHWHIDLLKDEKIEVRFDLYNSMPSYKRINIKNSLFSSIVENRVLDLVNLNGNSVKIYYPSLVDEIIIKYLDYIEHYKLRPDKVRHLDYVLEKIKKDRDNREFIDKLHFYTSFSRDVEVSKKSLIENFYEHIEYWLLRIFTVIKYVKIFGISETIKKIKKKLLK